MSGEQIVTPSSLSFLRAGSERSEGARTRFGQQYTTRASEYMLELIRCAVEHQMGSERELERHWELSVSSQFFSVLSVLKLLPELQLCPIAC